MLFLGRLAHGSLHCFFELNESDDSASGSVINLLIASECERESDGRIFASNFLFNYHAL